MDSGLAINYRSTDSTGDFTQQAATASPAAITGLTNATEYRIFVTAANPNGTSNPSPIISATPTSTAQARTADYTDVPSGHTHHAAITQLKDWDILDGTDCGINRFCPGSALARWKLAVWLVRALDRLNAAPDDTDATDDNAIFNDVKKQWYRPFVERLSILGVTHGCVRRSAIFCPNDTVTRAQMATFLVRAFNVPSATSQGFTDTAGHFHAENIDAIAAAGIAHGCNTDPLEFCPNDPTSNAQMASFIHRACTNTNPVIGRDCSPTDIDNGNDNGGTQLQPGQPTEIDVTPGPGTLHITWTPNGPAATQWRIGAYRVGRQGIGTSPDNDNSPITADPAAGHTITGLAFNTEYLIRIQGINQRGTGTAGTARKMTGRAAVELKALEITQGLQNWNGDITLVKGKRTVVRAFLEPTSGTATRVDVKLQAVVDGRVVATSSPQNPDTQTGPPSEYNEYLFTVRDGAAADRDLLGASANFLLDLDVPPTRQEWVGSPSGQPNLSLPGSSHSVTYRLVVDDGVVCEAAAVESDSSAPPGTACKADLEFRYVHTPTVRLVGVGYDDGTGGIDVPTHDDLDEQAQRILSVMPIPALDYDLRQLNHTYASAPSLTDVPTPLLSRLLLTRATDASTRVYLGVLLGLASGTTGRALDIPGNVAAWYTSERESTEAFGIARNRGAHEFGHLVGLHHTEDRDGDIVCGVLDADLDFSANPVYPEYPYTEMTTGGYRALLGPAAVDDDERVWGFDTRFVDPGSADPTMIDNLAVINPEEVFALMSYCGHDDTQARWVDRIYHRLLIDRINGINWSLGPAAGRDDNPEPLEPTHPLFSGHTTTTADGLEATAVLLPVFKLAAVIAAPEPPGSGGYVLELLDASGTVLRSVRFAAQTAVADASGGSEAGPSLQAWAVSVPDAPDYASVRVTRRSAPGLPAAVAEAQRSASDPTVSVTSPAAGSTVSGEFLEIAWRGSDADADQLSYVVQYSADGGDSYETLAADYRSMSLSVPREHVAGSWTARVRVLVSDGTRSTAARSALFTVANNTPRVSIARPGDGAVYGGLAPLVLEASARDSEDGLLEASALSWSSSIDGPLGTGTRLTVHTGDLTEGAHTLTVTATDNSNATASATIAVTVTDANEAPAPADDIAHAPVGATVRGDVLANDTDPEGDINPASLAVAVPAAAGQARARGGRIVYTAGEAGYDAYIYRVCDRANQCATAQATVISLSDP